MMASAVAILVVDDEPPIRRFLRTSLAAQGYRVLEAASGKEALSRIRIDRPDVLILDLGLPDVDGIDVIRIVRQTSKLPIIVLSSRDNERGKVEALDLGADDYVTKPFGMDELMARIRSALRHPGARRRLARPGDRPEFRRRRQDAAQRRAGLARRR